MNQNTASYDLYERQRQQAEWAMRRAQADALAAQQNNALSAGQRQEKDLAATMARDSYHQTLAANQSQHERNLQRSAMDHKFGDQQLQRDLADKETEREKERWGSIGRMFGGMGGMQGFGGTPGISLHDSGGQRIGGTSMGGSPLSGLTRK